MSVKLTKPKDNDEYHGDYPINFHGDYKPIHKADENCSDFQPELIEKERAKISLTKPTDITQPLAVINEPDVESEEEKQRKLQEDVEDIFNKYKHSPYNQQEEEYIRKQCHYLIGLKYLGIGIGILIVLVTLFCMKDKIIDIYDWVVELISSDSDKTATATDSVLSDVGIKDLITLLLGIVFGFVSLNVILSKFDKWTNRW